MAGYERILVPTDFSEPSRYALLGAADWARRFGGSIDLVHVVPLNGSGVEQAEASLETCVPAGIAELVASRRVERALAPELGILEAARKGHADLVAIATHGRSGLKHMLLGSVAQQVLHLASCPVLSFRAPGQGFERP